MCDQCRGGLGPKSLRGKMFYKSHRDILEKAANPFKKASLSLKKSSKIIEFFIKTPLF
jgi:hypothetical protein